MKLYMKRYFKLFIIWTLCITLALIVQTFVYANEYNAGDYNGWAANNLAAQDFSENMNFKDNKVFQSNAEHFPTDSPNYQPVNGATAGSVLYTGYQTTDVPVTNYYDDNTAPELKFVENYQMTLQRVENTTSEQLVNNFERQCIENRINFGP